MAVAVELQAKRAPRRYPQIDQAAVGVHEVEIIVQAFAAVWPDERLAGRLVMPGPVAVAGLHGRDDVHQAGVIATLRQHPRDILFLANMALGDVLDANSGL